MSFHILNHFITVAKVAELLLQFLIPQIWEPHLGLVLILTAVLTEQNKTKKQTTDIHLNSSFCTQKHCKMSL